MNTTVLSGFNHRFSQLATVTMLPMLQWATRHGYVYVCEPYDQAVNPYWQKIRQVITTLKRGWADRVIWLDCDQLVTNLDISFDQTSGVHFSRDWGVDATEDQHFSACGFVACRDALPLFEWVESVHDQYAHGDFPEQTPLRLAYAENRFPGLMHVHERRVFNAVPMEVHASVVEPWQPGDFAMHITMKDVEERVKLAEKYAR